MKTRLILFAVLLLGYAIILTSCAKDEVFTPVQKEAQLMLRNKGKAVVPFKGEYVTQVQIESIIPPLVTMNITAEGNATHLGKSSWEAVQMVFLPNPNSADPTYLYSDLITFTAANGDQLFGNYVGEAYWEVGVGSTFSGTMYITSGTGRFLGASGELPYYGESGEGGGFAVIHDGYLTYLDQ